LEMGALSTDPGYGPLVDGGSLHQGMFAGKRKERNEFINCRNERPWGETFETRRRTDTRISSPGRSLPVENFQRINYPAAPPVSTWPSA